MLLAFSGGEYAELLNMHAGGGRPAGRVTGGGPDEYIRVRDP
jgi:hypothetical protein